MVNSYRSVSRPECSRIKWEYSGRFPDRWEKTKPPSRLPLDGIDGRWGFCRETLRRDELLQNGVFERLGGPQAYDRLRLDLDWFARGRIAAHPSFAMRLHCASQSRYHELSRALGFFHREVEQLVEKRGNLFLGHRLVFRAHFLSQVRNDLRLAHRRCHRMSLSSSE